MHVIRGRVDENAENSEASTYVCRSPVLKMLDLNAFWMRFGDVERCGKGREGESTERGLECRIDEGKVLMNGDRACELRVCKP